MGFSHALRRIGFGLAIASVAACGDSSASGPGSSGGGESGDSAELAADREACRRREADENAISEALGCPYDAFFACEGKLGSLLKDGVTTTCYVEEAIYFDCITDGTGPADCTCEGDPAEPYITCPITAQICLEEKAALDMCGAGIAPAPVSEAAVALCTVLNEHRVALNEALGCPYEPVVYDCTTFALPPACEEEATAAFDCSIAVESVDVCQCFSADGYACDGVDPLACAAESEAFTACIEQ